MRNPFGRRDTADVQVFGSAADSEPVHAMLAGRLTGGRWCKWPAAKLSASRDEIRVRTSFRTYSWHRVDHPMIVRALIMGWEFGDPNGEPAPHMMFGTLHWTVGVVERKLEALGYEVRSRASR